MTTAYHTPAMLEEVLHYLAPAPGETHVDGTLGGGGHAAAIGARIAPGGRLVVIDQDPAALAAAEPRLGEIGAEVVPMHGNFRRLVDHLREAGVGQVDGVLLDLGVSSHQLDAGERGFSFRADAPLDMRMDPTAGETAADLLARLDARELTRIFLEYGEERWAARIAAFVVERRARQPVETTGQLADLVRAAIPKAAQPRDIHPATRVFQALRLAVNDELGALREALDGAAEALAPGGRVVVLSYHSLEDRITKQAFLRLSGRCQCPPGLPACTCNARQVLHVLTRKPVQPAAEEIGANPRARSARLRAAVKAQP